MSRIETWGGAECTVARIGDRFVDQLALTGHRARDGDFDRIAELKPDALRFPVLWEHVSPEPAVHDFTWSDRGLTRMRAHNIRPIVGLCHHGSGPIRTHLMAESFAPGLMSHARATAERYPWVDDWTPVNEPLTTARFSLLYGVWYPHRRDERAMWKGLLNQIDATCLSMKAIREVNPRARLVQTDDLGRTYATAPLSDQAAYDNTRRWMGWDLLMGWVTPGHALWDRLCGYGLERRLRHIAENPCPPAIIGINHYVTSDRFLDHRYEGYPRETVGGNMRVRYADVAAARAVTPPLPGIETAIRDAWSRYGLPVALTEVHLGCSREEQLRWHAEAWRAAWAARKRGVDVRAVTSWALFGSKGWNTLLTEDGTYEPGAFDCAGGQVRRTAVGASLAGAWTAPVAQGKGWWRRDERLLHKAVPVATSMNCRLFPDAEEPPLLIVGRTGTLGRAIAAACRARGLRHVVMNRQELDLTDPCSIEGALQTHRPWAVVNAGGWVRVDEAENARAECMAVNATGAIALADACEMRGIASASFSSDLVFGNTQTALYVESDRPLPLSVYGKSKARMEEGILRLHGRHLIVRTAAFFDVSDDANFAVQLVRALDRGERVAAAGDRSVTPTYVPDLCAAVLDLLIDGAAGVWHLSCGYQLTWAAFGRLVAGACGRDANRVDAVPASDLGWVAARPVACGLGSHNGCMMPSLDDALARFARQLR